jgi:hemerythrin
MTELLRWTESFSTGHIELDGEHRRMVDLINQVCLTCDANQRARRVNLLLELESLTEKLRT